MPVRLKLPRLEAKPKQVILAPTFRDPANLAHSDEFAKAVDRIRTCVRNGTPLPSSFYSKAAGMRRDEMLDRYGIMHLHLGRWTTDELLWLVQYPEHVVFLELSDHRPFAGRPPGVGLHRFHQPRLVAKEAELDRQIAADLAAGKVRRMTFGERRRAGLVKFNDKPKRS